MKNQGSTLQRPRAGEGDGPGWLGGLWGGLAWAMARWLMILDSGSTEGRRCPGFHANHKEKLLQGSKQRTDTF